MAHLRLLLLLFLGMILLNFPSQALAAATGFDFDWSAGIKIFDGREHGEGLPDRMDIRSAYYGSDDDFYYLRMDVYKDPTNANVGDSYAFFLDTREGGLDGGTGTIPYIPATLDGIDVAVGSSYIRADGYLPFFSEAGAGASNFTTYLGRDFYGLGGQYQRNSTVLEWAIPKEELGNDLVAWAATFGPAQQREHHFAAALGCRDEKGIWRTYDITSPITVTSSISTPIPAAGWLLVSGMVACGFGRRKPWNR